MNELYQIKDFSQAKVLLNPIRISILDHLRKPGECSEISKLLNMPS